MTENVSLCPLRVFPLNWTGSARRFFITTPLSGSLILPNYGVDTFTLCEINPYILITQPIYSDIHTNLITIPLETDYTMPYGLIYANEPTAATEKFIQATKKMLKKGELKNI